MMTSLSIRYKIAAALLAVLCLAIAFLGTISFQVQKSTLEAEMQLRGRGLARQLASAAKTALLDRDELAAADAIGEVRRSGVLYAAILDRKGVLFADSDQRFAGRHLDAEADAFTRGATSMRFRELPEADAPMLEVVAPVIVRYAGRSARAGSVRLGISLAPLLEAVARQERLFLFMGAAFLLAGLLISLMLGGVLTRRIVALMRGMTAVAEGNLEHAVAVGARDEIGVLEERFNDMLRGLREKLRMEKYLSRSTVQLVKRLEGLGELKLGGERRRVAVLFSDIRGFTALTETLGPEDVVRTLNIYLNLQSEVIHQRGGVVDKFVGDAVMALFTGDAAEFRAALVAQEILNFVSSLNDSRGRASKPTMRVGIGLNAGNVILANMGSERQMSYTAIGDPINTAARLCSAARPGQAVVSRAIVEAVGDRCRVDALAPMSLKGKAEPVEAWELVDVPKAARSYFRRPVRLKADCRVLDRGESVEVLVSELGPGGCRVRSASPLEPGSSVQLDLTMQPLGRLSMQAAVRHASAHAGRFVAGLAFEHDERHFDALTEWAHDIRTELV